MKKIFLYRFLCMSNVLFAFLPMGKAQKLEELVKLPSVDILRARLDRLNNAAVRNFFDAMNIASQFANQQLYPSMLAEILGNFVIAYNKQNDTFFDRFISIPLSESILNNVLTSDETHR